MELVIAGIKVPKFNPFIALRKGDKSDEIGIIAMYIVGTTDFLQLAQHRTVQFQREGLMSIRVNPGTMVRTTKGTKGVQFLHVLFSFFSPLLESCPKKPL